MELYACGYNGNGQFNRESHCVRGEREDQHPSRWYESMCDRVLLQLEKTVSANKIRLLWAADEGTLLQVTNELHYLGAFNRRLRPTEIREAPYISHGGRVETDLPISDLIYVIPELMLFSGGLVRTLKHIEGTYQLVDPVAEAVAKQPSLQQINSPALLMACGNQWPQRLLVVPTAAGTASASQVVVEFSGQAQGQWRRASDQVTEWMVGQSKPQHSVSFPMAVRQIAAGLRTSYALTADNRIFAWPKPSWYNAGQPVAVNLPPVGIRKIVAGDWMAAAVTEEQDLYLWGETGTPCLDDLRINDLPRHFRVAHEGVEVRKVEVGNGAKIADVAIGTGHVVVLTVDGRLFAAGDGVCGELGIGPRVFSLPEEYAQDWIELAFETPLDKRLCGVFCGPSNTFALVEPSPQAAENITN
ncbi:MAG: hypothetical protein M1817_005043 [Caeruleum heppii]|nr:MAG: hypothetical protein M1817_005043 [Caeruleum heppii]